MIPQLKSAFIHLPLALILFFATAANAQTNTLSEAEIKGRELAQQLCDGKPTEAFKKTGELQIRNGEGNRTNIVITCIVTIDHETWQSIYTAVQTNFSKEYSPHVITHSLSIKHFNEQPNRYELETSRSPAFDVTQKNDKATGKAILENPLHIVSTISKLDDKDICKPFANSDFWLCDLGLEFFHWPDQKVLPKTTNLKRGRAYTLLESTNPNPGTNGYSRVVSWVDQETGGILQAEAYDTQGKLLKEFEPKSFKKVNGQWELQEMQIRNVQTGSRTRIEFDLKK